ncbi:MAG: M48 family metalloprotease [Methanoregula sp.]|nr:MAG: M48 family metalloprotease [Methanoregula sp.]
MAIFLVIDTVGNLKDIVLMIFKKKVEIPVPVEVSNLAKSMGVTCNSFKIVMDNFNACVLPTGSVFIGDKTFFTLNKEELLAVFAHEFAHNKKRHYWIKISAFALLLLAGYTVFNGLPEFMMWYALFAFTSITMIPVSWYLELDADGMGKKFVGAEHMISALEKTSIDRDQNEGSESHPPINARIRALKVSQ